MKRSTLDTLVLVLVAGLAFGGCAVEGGCFKDTDCADGRICEEGVCVSDSDFSGLEGGGGGGGGDSQPSETGDCLDVSCNSELNACEAGCQSLLDCLFSCETDSCAEGCVERSAESAVGQVSDLFDCYDAYCADGGGSGGDSTSTDSTSGASSAAINQCITGAGNFCGCAAAADDSCSDSESDSYYNTCVAGEESGLFDALYCMGQTTPSSLQGCLDLFDRCFP